MDSKNRTHHYREDTPPFYADGQETAERDAQRIRQVSLKFQRALGYQVSLPFKKPPPMVGDFLRAFEEGLGEFGANNDRTPVISEKEKVGQVGLPGHEVEVSKEDVKNKKEGADNRRDMPNMSNELREVSSERGGDGQGIPTPALFPSPTLEKVEPPAASEEQKDDPSRVDTFLANCFKRPRPPFAVPKPPDPPLQPPPSKATLIDFKDRKRTLSTSQADLTPTHPSSAPPTQQKKPRHNDSAGISCLPPHFSSAWSTTFPGNAPGLANTLATWHRTLTYLYQKYPSPHRMQIHPIFPYPVTCPVSRPLLSAAFYDTSTTPPTELRFIGLDSVAALMYGEVDTFSGREDTECDKARDDEAGRREQQMRMFLRGDKPGEKALRRQDVRCWNERGEGRWAFLIVRGRRNGVEPKEVVGPYVFVAWPVTGATGWAECLTTIHPDVDCSAKLSSTGDEQGRLGAAVSACLRCAAGSSSVPAAELDPPPKGAMNVLRTTVSFQKAGGVPLVEAYRTDVASWRPFLEAVGKGKGQIVVFSEVVRVQGPPPV